MWAQTTFENRQRTAFANMQISLQAVTRSMIRLLTTIKIQFKGHGNHDLANLLSNLLGCIASL